MSLVVETTLHQPFCSFGSPQNAYEQAAEACRLSIVASYAQIGQEHAHLHRGSCERDRLPMSLLTACCQSARRPESCIRAQGGRAPARTTDPLPGNTGRLLRAHDLRPGGVNEVGRAINGATNGHCRLRAHHRAAHHMLGRQPATSTRGRHPDTHFAQRVQEIIARVGLYHEGHPLFILEYLPQIGLAKACRQHYSE